MCYVCAHEKPGPIPYAHWIHIREDLESAMDTLGDVYYDYGKGKDPSKGLTEAIRSLMELQTYCLQNIDD